MSEIDHQYTKEITCPYCGEELLDSWEYDEEGTVECGECGFEFDYYRDVDVTYVTKRND